MPDFSLRDEGSDSPIVSGDSGISSGLLGYKKLSGGNDEENSIAADYEVYPASVPSLEDI